MRAAQDAILAARDFCSPAPVALPAATPVVPAVHSPTAAMLSAAHANSGSGCSARMAELEVRPGNRLERQVQGNAVGDEQLVIVGIAAVNPAIRDVRDLQTQARFVIKLVSGIDA